MYAAIFRGERDGRTRLIRKVDSRILLVHDNPLQILNPYAWRGFSLFQGTLRGWIKELREEHEFRLCMIQFPVEIEADPAPDKDDPLKVVKRMIEYRWERVIHAVMINHSPAFVLHPSLVE